MPISPARPAVQTRTAATAPAVRGLAPIGAWQPVGLLGQGAWSCVFASRPAGASPFQPAAYALKTLRAEFTDNPRALELFCREARVGRRVSHPHVVPVLAAELHTAPYHLVMPRLTGQTLAQRLARSWQPAVPEALWIARQVAEGLAALAAAGWMHADVKPTNIFVSPAGHATLIDLGFARRLEEMTSIATRPVLGTVEYLSPELLTASQPADIRSDVYSLGVVLFELLARRRPYVARDIAEVVALQRAAPPPDVRTLSPQIPASVAGLVRQMLSKQPLRRPEPHELVARLTALEIETFDERALVEIV